MRSPQSMAFQLLKKEAADLELRLSRVRCAITSLAPSAVKPELARPKSKLDLLREILRQHPEGVRVKEINGLLRAKGHISYSMDQSLNWLCPSQLPPMDCFFIREDGWIKPTQDFLESDSKDNQSQLPSDNNT